MLNNPPKIWLLKSPHTGDNTQLLALAESLGWSYETKTLTYKPSHKFSRFLPNSLNGLTDAARAQLSPPYPDLILGAGQPAESPALWLKNNAGKNLRVVYLGTPWAALSNFDLIITTPQYQLPRLENILHLELPLHKVEPEKLQSAAEHWLPKLNHLPRPWTAVLVGGESGPYTFAEAAAMRLAKQAQALDGSLLITTSARTPDAVAKALQKAITAPHYFHQWDSAQIENPFFGFLALADKFIVTADSVSMLAEACATGKPVQMFDTEDGRFAMHDRGGAINWLGRTFNTTLFRIAMRLAPKRWSRDLRIVHQQLVKSGQASWNETGAMPQRTTATALQAATTRVKALFDL